MYREMHSPLNTPHASNASPGQVRVHPCPLGITSHRCDSGFLSLCTVCLRAPCPPSPWQDPGWRGSWQEGSLCSGLIMGILTFPSSPGFLITSHRHCARPSSRGTQSQPLFSSRPRCGFWAHSSPSVATNTGEDWGSPDPGRQVNPPSSPKKHLSSWAGRTPGTALLGNSRCGFPVLFRMTI